MVTLRTFPDPVTAGLARALLRDRGIPCELADVESHLYSAAMIAIPVRLLVPQDTLEEAGQILDSTDLALPPDFDPSRIEE
jgi:hypothetical protein